MMTPTFIHAGSVSQLGPSMPMTASPRLSKPLRPLRMSRNSVPTATAGVTLGR